MTIEPLWTGARLNEAMGARSQGPVPAAVTTAALTILPLPALALLLTVMVR